MRNRVAWPVVLSVVVPWIVVSAACNASISPAVTVAPTVTAAPVATRTSESLPSSTPAATPTRVPPTRVPATATRTPPPPSATPVPTPVPGSSHEEVFESAWQAVHDYYAYPDFNGLDWDAVHEEYGTRVRAATNDEAFYALMKEMIDALKDNHSRFLTPDEVRHEDQRQAGGGDYVGVGFASFPLEEKRLGTIMLVWPDSPAAAAGLRAHDNILAIDGRPAVVPGEMYMTGLAGEEGTAVTVTMRTPGKLPHDVVLVRKRLPLPAPVIVKRLPGDIAYLMVPTFYDDTVVDRLIAALDELAKDGPPFRGMVLDMRINVGGMLTPAKQLWSLFTDGSVLHLIYHGGRYKITVQAQDVQGSQTLPLVVLAGPYSESLGEVTAGILQDLGRARVVGMQTKGNVELIQYIDFPDGSRLWLAQGIFLPRLHGDVVWNGVGITPDVLVDAPWETFPEDADPQLQAALALLR